MIVALFLIFRDDKDGSYNRSEKAHRKVQYPKEAGAGMKVMDAIPVSEPEVAPFEASKDVEVPESGEEDSEDEELDLSFLDEIEYSDDLDEDTETFDITGLQYYCTVHDCGKIVGVVVYEPSNVHDSRARAVISNEGKLLGYIPRNQLDWYEEFNEDDVPCPFVGGIVLDNYTMRLTAEIKVILPSSREFVEEEIEAGV